MWTWHARLMGAAARSVADPKGRGTLYDVWRAAGAGAGTGGYGVVAGARGEDPPVLVPNDNIDISLPKPSAGLLGPGPR